jgi:hypothetical protein
VCGFFLLLQLSVVGRFDTWSTAHGPFSGKVGALQRLRQPGASAVAVRDTAGFLEAMHLFAIHHYLTVSERGFCACYLPSCKPKPGCSLGLQQVAGSDFMCS